MFQLTQCKTCLVVRIHLAALNLCVWFEGRRIESCPWLKRICNILCENRWWLVSEKYKAARNEQSILLITLKKKTNSIHRFVHNVCNLFFCYVVFHYYPFKHIVVPVH